jgi:hypothetical protein
MKFIDVMISKEMIKEAKNSVEKVKVNRTVASPIDTIVGLIGEFAFAEWFYGNWKEHDHLNTKGQIDFINQIEVKTSAYPFRENLNLLVREDYAKKRKPNCYVQTIIDTPKPYVNDILPGWICRLSGWASHKELIDAPIKDFGAKGGGRGGYRCFYIPIYKLNSMASLPIQSPRNK